jgi:hypothetical protein
MGWANCGTDDQGRPIGYSFAATCDHPGCAAEIDRGLSYACGSMHGGSTHGCGKYFCAKHLLHKALPGDSHGDREFVQLCPECIQWICGFDGCDEGVEPAAGNECVGCHYHYCDRHGQYQTIASGEPAFLCVDCAGPD